MLSFCQVLGHCPKSIWALRSHLAFHMSQVAIRLEEVPADRNWGTLAALGGVYHFRQAGNIEGAAFLEIDFAIWMQKVS